MWRQKMTGFKEKAPKILTHFLLIGIALLTASIVIYDYCDEQEHARINELYSGPNGCPISNEKPRLRSNTIVILDFSDPVTSQGFEYIRKDISIYYENLKEREKLTVLFVKERGHKELFQVCKPPNPKHYIRNKQWKCLQDLEGIDNTNLNNQTAGKYCGVKKDMDELLVKFDKLSRKRFRRTPLLETLVAISGRQDFLPDMNKHIVLFSDLQQNTDKYSFYKHARAPKPVVDAVLINMRKLLDLRGTKVDAHIINRPNYGNKIRVKNFWEELFLKTTGARPEFHNYAAGSSQ